MSKGFEDFVNKNRDEFDKFEPGPVVWHNIQQELKKPAKKEGVVISIKAIRWAAAAAVLLLMGGAAWYYLGNKKNGPEFAANQPVKTPKQNALQSSPDTIKQNPDTNKEQQPTHSEDAQLAKTDDEGYNEEMYHYARLIELKQSEIKKIKNEEPLLYREFAGDFNKLDSTFHILKKQLPVNPNREQILEAMIQNLQYQEALLNQQLNIIKKINNTKKEAYEKAYRSA